MRTRAILGASALLGIAGSPGKDWFVYLRLYGPIGSAFDGSWKPGDFENIE